MRIENKKINSHTRKIMALSS